MASMVCGKCQSESTYYQDGGWACMKCGNRSPSRWGFHLKGEAPEPIVVYEEPELEDEETEQEEEMNMGKKRTPEQIERIRAGIRAAIDRKKAASGGGQSKVEKKSKPAAPTAETDRLKKIRTAAAEMKAAKIDGATTLLKLIESPPPDPPDVELKIRHIYPPGIVPLDFTLEENKHLLEPWTKYCRRNFRREPSDQAMMAIEEILTNEGLI